MSLYDNAKDVLKIVQTLDNPELIQKVLDVQKDALEMQEKQMQLITTIDAQSKELMSLKEMGKLVHDGDHGWLIDPDHAAIKYCPTCANRDRFRNPMIENGGGYYCVTCNTEQE